MHSSRPLIDTFRLLAARGRATVVARREPQPDLVAPPSKRALAVARERPPRLVLRFAILSALCLGTGAAAILGVVRHLNTVQAERTAAQHAEFVAETVLIDALRARDFTSPVTARRRAQLDRLFERTLLDHGVLVVTLSRRDRVVTYSTDHTLIGRRVASAARTREAFRGTLTSEVTETPGDGKFKGLKVLQSYVPLTPKAGGRGVVGIYQDYAPIASAAHAAFMPIAGILELVLVLLYVLLVPLLGRVARRIRRQIEHIEHQAFHDDLTDLPNRLQFRRRIAAAIAEAPAGSDVAVLLLDLDRFKEVNDTLGHSSGDELLEQLSARLQAVLDGPLLARLGGDEFGIVAPATSPEDAHGIAAAVREALESPFNVRSVPLVVECSVGIAMFPHDGDEVDLLIQRADIAMYEAKARRLGVARYEPELDTSTAAQLALMSDLRDALDGDELVLHFQPKVDIATAEICGVEALVRWQHPVHGLLQPSAFLPFAERTGMSRGLTRLVLARAVEQMAAWTDREAQLSLSVNLTMFDLLDLTLPDEVAAVVDAAGVDPARLELEITESMIMSDAVRIREVVTRLKDVGVMVAIDDFGTGFSSLSYLKTLPVDVLKIDRSFVSGMVADDRDLAIVRSTADLGHSLGLRVVAEGVSSPEVWDAVQKIGCDIAQGYYVAPPCASGDLPATLDDWRQRGRVHVLPRTPRARARAARPARRRSVA